MKTRILSAIVMIAVFIPLLVIGGKPFAIFMTLLALVGLYEILHIRESRKEFPLMMKIFAYLMVVFFSMTNFKSIEFLYNVDYRVMAFIIFAFLAPMVFINDTKKYNLNDSLFLIGSVLFIGMSFNLLIITRNYDLSYILYLLLITTITDTFALFTGMLVGKHKLCPEISPKKTVEGLLGGTFMGVIVATAFYLTVINSHVSLVLLILVTAALSLVGQLGDLVFSIIKRYYGKKDFSNLIPGHGGILDRFDSIIFVALAFILFLGII
ncbi:MAG: phosphatidate cytidylyltransferase [Firmicutes bacterium]|nr:phosphatidate cytidylyltransferase [Bacillota bacterium]